MIPLSTKARYSWDNGQKGERRRLARLDRYYLPTHSRLNIHLAAYYIHEYSVGSDPSPVHLELHIRESEMRKTTFKWNVSYLKDDIVDKLEKKWEGLPRDAHFFHKIRIVSRHYRQMCKQKAKTNRKLLEDSNMRR